MTSSSVGGERITSAWVMGVLAALRALAIALALCVVPALAAQVVGGSTLSVLDAVMLGLDAFVLGHGGALVLATPLLQGSMTLAPLGLTLVLLLLAAASMRRMGRALDLVEPSGVLRPGALGDAGRALGAFTVLYAALGGVIAALARTPLVHPVTSSAIVACALVALLGGLGGLAAALRREEAPGVPEVRVLSLLPSPFGAVARGAMIALLGLVAAGMLVCVGAIVIAWSRVGALFDQLDPGIIGGIVLTLLQLALLPTFALWTLSVLLGAGFSVGIGTSVSLGSSSLGVLPALPMLGALPQPGAGPGWIWILMALPVIALGLGAASVVREVRGAPLRDRAIAWVSYVAVVLVAVLLLLSLSGGTLGDGRLRELGPATARAALPLLAMLVGVTALMVIALDSPLLGWVRGRTAALRERVEQEEAREAGVDGDPETGNEPAPEPEPSHEDPPTPVR